MERKVIRKEVRRIKSEKLSEPGYKEKYVRVLSNKSANVKKMKLNKNGYKLRRL